MKAIDKALDKSSMWLCYAGCAVIFVTFLSLMCNVIMRIFGSAFYYNNEIVRYCLLFGICFVVPRATYCKQHIRVTMLVDILPGKFHRTLNILMHSLAFAVFIVIGYCLVRATSTLTIRVQRTDVLNLPVLWMYVAMAVSFILSSLCFLFQTITEAVNFNVKHIKISEIEKLQAEIKNSELE